MRERVLVRDPVCRICNRAPSRHADHIIPLARGGTNHESNYQGTCHSCHSAKTASHDGGFGNPITPSRP
jgi:5-methylcytosine-specific restriction protein A